MGSALPPSARSFDAAIIGGGHNGLVAGAILARQGRRVVVIEASDVIGGACRTERPFKLAPGLGCSTGAYLLGPMPPEVIQATGLNDRIRILPRRPHGYLLLENGDPVAFGVPEGDALASEHDRRSMGALDALLGALRDDLGPAWLREPVSHDESALLVRDTPAPAPYPGSVRDVYRTLVLHGSVADLLRPLALESELLAATIASDGLVGSARGLDHPGTAMNFLVHNMLRLPPGDGPWSAPPLGAWQLVEGGMGAVTQALGAVITDHGGVIVTRTRASRPVAQPGGGFAVPLSTGESIEATRIILATAPAADWAALDGGRDPFTVTPGPLTAPAGSALERGTSLKVNLALSRLPRVRGVERLPTHLRSINPLCGTVHVLPASDTLSRLARARSAAVDHSRLPDPFDCMIDVYTHTAVDHTLRDEHGRHAMSLFVQWVPNDMEQDAATAFAHELVRGPVSQMLPDIQDCIVEAMVLCPRSIASRFGLPSGHIHHSDNAHAWRDRLPLAPPVAGMDFACAGAFPAGSVIGAAGFQAAHRTLAALDIQTKSY